MSDCVFCDIIAGKAPAQIVYQDELRHRISRPHPRAPVHLLIVPNRHITSCGELAPGDEPVVGHLLVKAAQLADQEKLSELIGWSSTPGAEPGSLCFIFISTC